MTKGVDLTFLRQLLHPAMEGFWTEHRIGRFCWWIAWQNSRHLATLPLVSPAKWRLRNERRNFKLTTRHYPDLGSASDWSCGVGNLLQPIRSTAQIRVVTRHQYGISALVSQTSFRGIPAVASGECRLFPQVDRWSAVQFSCNRRWFECQGTTPKTGRQCCPLSSNIPSMRLLQFGSDKTPHEGRKGWWDSCTRTAFGTERCVGKRHLFW